MKRKSTDLTNSTKKPRVEEVSSIKKIILRNDIDPHVYTNIESEYVKIGNFIYKTASDEKWIEAAGKHPDNKIGLNLSQFNSVNSYIFDEKKIMVKNFTQKVGYAVKLSVNLANLSTHKLTTKRRELSALISKFLEYQIVQLDQYFHLEFNAIPIKVTIEEINDGEILGMIKNYTEIDFKNYGHNITIYEDNVYIDNKSVNVIITNCISTKTREFYPNNQAFPLIIDKAEINRYIKNAIPNTFTDNEIFKYTSDDYEYTFKINIINENNKSRYECTYKLMNNEPLQVRSNLKNVIVTEGIKNATKISFTCTSLIDQLYSARDYILVADDVINYVKEKYKNITTKHLVKYINRRDKEIKLQINYIEPESTNIFTYMILPSTKIIFDTNKKLSTRFILVNNRVPHEIEKITFKIKKDDGGGDLFSMMFGIKFSDGDKSSSIYKSKKLEKLIREKFPTNTALKHRVTVSYDGEDCILIVKNIEFKDKEIKKDKKNRYEILGNITNDTIIKFEISKNDNNISIDEEGSQIMENPVEEMEKYVGGLSEQLHTIVRTIALARGKLREEFIARGLKPIKGMVFHGPPGTGKTSIARQMGKIFGCTGDRFHLMSGPEVFNKYVGQSEANVRAIFKPAKEAWKKHGINSPLYMVVVDEIDAMLPIRSGSSGNPVRDSVVNQFLAEIDGLVEFDNMIVIGLTNRLELLDAAAIRAGRLEIHVKIDLPDKNGRLKIFEIHTRKLTELKRLENINFQELADLTDGFCGADIEGIVKIASTYSLERLTKFDKIDKEILDKEGQIKQEDFLRAIQEIKGKNGSDTKYLSMYI